MSFIFIKNSGTTGLFFFLTSLIIQLSHCNFLIELVFIQYSVYISGIITFTSVLSNHFNISNISFCNDSCQSIFQ
ncbi:hypothetical protein HOF65_05105 [bacterium]|nr:hypothetical protein [bacterium]